VICHALAPDRRRCRAGHKQIGFKVLLLAVVRLASHIVRLLPLAFARPGLVGKDPVLAAAPMRLQLRPSGPR
jgi:cytochrome b561